MFARKLAVMLMASGVWAGLAGPANAKMYKYTDRSGQDHFVDSQSKIPQEYREQQEEIQPVRNESSAIVPAAPVTAKSPRSAPASAVKSPGTDPECARKREQIGRDIAENQKKAAQWDKEHAPAGTDKTADPAVQRAAEKAIEKCLGGASLDPAKALEAIQANQSCIAGVAKEENASADEKSDNPYVRRVKSSQDELERLKAKCGG